MKPKNQEPSSNFKKAVKEHAEKFKIDTPQLKPKNQKKVGKYFYDVDEKTGILSNPKNQSPQLKQPAIPLPDGRTEDAAGTLSDKDLLQVIALLKNKKTPKDKFRERIMKEMANLSEREVFIQRLKLADKRLDKLEREIKRWYQFGVDDTNKKFKDFIQKLKEVSDKAKKYHIIFPPHWKYKEDFHKGAYAAFKYMDKEIDKLAGKELI